VRNLCYTELSAWVRAPNPASIASASFRPPARLCGLQRGIELAAHPGDRRICRIEPVFLRKTHVPSERPPFERVVLLLQGGGALGAYQAGVHQALAEANLHPDWVAGISIGAINSALIAGNPPERRVEKLREFWETISAPPFGGPYITAIKGSDEFTRTLINQASSWETLVGGAPGFFQPRVPRRSSIRAADLRRSATTMSPH